MTDEQDQTDKAPTKPEPAVEQAATVDAGGERRALTSDDFLVSGPSPESNEGLRRWGLTWLAFSLLLIVLMLCVSFACLTLANWTGIS